jgi:hypothetical protein
MIFDHLIPKLEEHFPNRGLRVETSPEARAVFSAMHPEVGNVEIHEDGNEIIIYLGNFTHVHLANYDENLSKEQKSEKLAEDVVANLKNLFADQIILWGSHRGGGGCRERGEPSIFKTHKKEYVWSGPLP